MRLKREMLPVAVAGVSVVALLAVAGAIFATYYSPKPTERLGVVPQGDERVSGPRTAPETESSSHNPEKVLVPVANSLTVPNELANTTSSQGEVNAWQDGDGEVRLVSQGSPVMPENGTPKNEGEIAPKVNSHDQDALILGEPGDLVLAEGEVQVPLLATSEVAPPTPAPANTPPLSIVVQAVPGTELPALSTFASQSRAPSEEVGGLAAKVDDGDQASEPGSVDAGQNTNDQVLSIPEKEVLKYPNLGSHLNQLVSSVEEGRATAQQAAEGASIYSNESIAVTIHLTGHVDEVVTFLEDNGGDPRNVGEDYIEAYVPVPLLGPVSERLGVIRVREIVPPQRN